jgi:hypothetical protein
MKTLSIKNSSRQFRAFALLVVCAVVGCFAAVAAPTEALAPVYAICAASILASSLTFNARLSATHALDLISYSATQPNTGAAAAAVTGDSLVVKNAKGSARIIQMIGDNQTAGFHQVAFPSGHDTTRGYRTEVRADSLDFLIAEGLSIPVQPQETLSVQVSGSNTAGDIEQGCFVMLYENLAGTAQRMIAWNVLQKKIKALTTIDLALAGAGAGYTGSEAMNVDIDLLRSNTDYALLGAVSDKNVILSVLGPDTGNLRLGIPVNAKDPEGSVDYFPRLARAQGLPLIPVLNSGNKTSTLVSFLQDENNISPKVTLYLAMLSTVSTQEA